MFTTVEEALEYLGAEARKVYEEGAEEPWELRPEHAGDDPAWYEWCDDCETFHTNHYPIGYEVTQGCVEMVAWCCDQDGNWDVVDGACIGTPDHKALMENYGYEAWQRNYAEYLRHVAETGEDPCGEFIPPPPIKTDELWMVRVIERGEKVWVTRAARIATNEVYYKPTDLPDYVQGYLLLERLGDIGACAIDPANIKSVADIPGEKWEPGDHRGEWVATVTIQRQEPAVSDEEWAKTLREKANKARASMVFHDS